MGGAVALAGPDGVGRLPFGDRRGGSLKVEGQAGAGGVEQPADVGETVVGDFNDWNPFAHPLKRRANGTRSAVVRIPAGTQSQFRYLAEGGLWFDDESGVSVLA